jgi:hypothetical protein
MDGEYENPEGASGCRIVLSGRPFLFGDFFLWASKEKVTRPRQRTKTGAFWKARQQRPWIPAFAGMTAVTRAADEERRSLEGSTTSMDGQTFVCRETPLSRE